MIRGLLEEKGSTGDLRSMPAAIECESVGVMTPNDSEGSSGSADSRASGRT